VTCSETGWGRPLVILDRDGVINFDSDHYIKSIAEWTPIPGSVEGIAELWRCGFRVAIATNQSGVARGLFPLAELHRMHQRLRELVRDAGGRIELIAFCPHAPGASCLCRKPLGGLLDEIAAALGQRLTGVPFVGDSLSDVRAARNAGASPFLVRTGKGERTLKDIADKGEDGGSELAGVQVFADLAEATRWLVQPSGCI
jgi:D-glycero-D-manno-heptose 1,7-bisphosphate phosphatase